MWIFDTGEINLVQHEDMLCSNTNACERGFLEVDFIATMSAWSDRPAWVDLFIANMHIILDKKGWVAICDIMRMIILYYRGGLYLDVKIIINDEHATFFAQPKVTQNHLMCYQTVDGRKENWSLLANRGCYMIDQIMHECMQNYPCARVLHRLPINYQTQPSSTDKIYWASHADLHEDWGPWRLISNGSYECEIIQDHNSSLGLTNPRPLNSWENSTHDYFDWRPVEGMKLISIEGDGHCLFRAVAALMKSDVNALRVTVHNAVTTNDELRQKIYGDSQPGSTKYDRIQALTNMHTDIVWGGDEEIRVLSFILRRPIAVHHHDGITQLFDETDEGNGQQIIDDLTAIPPNALHLYMPTNQHFDALY